MACLVRRRLTVSVRAFGPALVTHLARLGFFFAGLVVCFGPMAAVRAEMPGVAVAFASIGLCHGVLCSLWKVPGANLRALVETQWGDGKALAASAFQIENLKRWAG